MAFVTTDWETWFAWLEAAAGCNEYVEPITNAAGRIGGLPAGEDAPGTDFNRTGSWGDTGLFDAGWSWCRRIGDDRGFLTRPGKAGGVSASVGMCTSTKNGWPLFWPFTSSTEFQPDTAYTRFGVYAALKHGGDFKKAAEELRAKGYGGRAPEPTVTFGQAAPADGGPPRLFKWMSELEHRPENEKWLWKGYLSRGGLTVLSALWKAGKSTLLSHLLRACDGRTTEFLGREIVPFRVLFVSEEHEELWADRRDELGIRDHVGLVSRPFKGRASPAQWTTFLGKVADEMVAHHFDLLVIDTISKMWPVRDEDDAGQVEEALMPLWTITGLGAATLLVHHNRKSGGKNFTGMRGSGGLPAFAETLIEFDRASDDRKDFRRVLNSEGRYRESSGRILIELRSGAYTCVDRDYEGEPGAAFPGGSKGGAPPVEFDLGDGDKLLLTDTHRRVLAVLPDDEDDGISQNEIFDLMQDRNWEWVSKGARNGFIVLMIKAKLVLKQKVGHGYYRTPLGATHAARPGSGSGGSAPGGKSEPEPQNQGSGVVPGSGSDSHRGAEPVEPEPPGYDCGPDLLLMIQHNGPQTAEQLSSLSGFSVDEIRVAMGRYIGPVLALAADGVYSLVTRRGDRE